MLQKIRVLVTLVVFSGGRIHFCFSESCMCCKSCFYELYFYSLWRLILSCHTSSGLFVHFSHFYMNYLLEKKKKKLIVIWCVCCTSDCLFQYADLVFPGFFFSFFGIVHLI